MNHTLVRRRRKLAILPLVALSILGGSGCSQLAQTMAALGGTGSTTSAAVTSPSVLGTSALGATNTAGSLASLPNLLGAQTNPSSPAAMLPAPAAATQEVQRLNSKFSIQISGSCAEGRALQNLEAGLAVFQNPQRFQGVAYDIPCDTQDEGGAAGEWTGEMSNGPYRIILNGAPFHELERSLFIHETGHHLHLAHTNTDIKQNLESTVQTTPEYYPSVYSRPDPSRPPRETVSKDDGTQMVLDIDQGEQIAELITYCKELANGGVLNPLADDTPNWSCPASMSPVIQPL